MDYFEEQFGEAQLASSASARKPKPVADEEGQLTVDVYQTDDDIVVKSTIAGVTPEDLDISITNDMVTIRGQRNPEDKVKQGNYFTQELYWGAFSRSIILPEEIDPEKAAATMKNGVLTLRLPKMSRSKVKKIKISQ